MIAYRFLRWSVFYFVAASLLGPYMAAGGSENFEMIHVHLNLIGWLSFAIAGVLYLLFTDMGKSQSARLHFWLGNLSLWGMGAGFVFVKLGGASFASILWISGMLQVVSIIMFASAVYRYVR